MGRGERLRQGFAFGLGLVVELLAPERRPRPDVWLAPAARADSIVSP